MRRHIGVALVVSWGWFAIAAPDARADGAAECVKESERGNTAREQGKLREARRSFVTCAADSCPKNLRIDCARWLEDVDASLPTVVFGAKGPDGADIFDVGVFVDGEKVTGHEQGKAVSLDPGPHVIRFEHPPNKPETLKVLLRAGEHNRPILATFSADVEPSDSHEHEHDHEPTKDKPEPARSESGIHVPTASIVLGAIGVVALGSFAFFGITGMNEKSRLRGVCSPHCTDAEVSKLKTDYIIGDVSLGVGLIALGVATFLWLTDTSAKPTSYGRFARTIWK